MGEQYIGIEAGGSEKNMAAGDVINQTQSAVVLENLISQFLFSKAAETKSPDSAVPASVAPASSASPMLSAPQPPIDKK